MQTIILYATKHGGTREIAQRIASKIPGSEMHDLKQSPAPSLSQYDCIIIGSPLYAGAIRKEVKAFLLQSAEALQKKRLGLFLSGLSPEEKKTFFEANYSPEILQSAKAKGFLGGIYDPKKAGFMERFLMKAIAKQKDYADKIDDTAISQFVKDLQA